MSTNDLGTMEVEEHSTDPTVGTTDPEIRNVLMEFERKEPESTSNNQQQSVAHKVHDVENDEDENNKINDENNDKNNEAKIFDLEEMEEAKYDLNEDATDIATRSTGKSKPAPHNATIVPPTAKATATSGRTTTTKTTAKKRTKTTPRKLTARKTVVAVAAVAAAKVAVDKTKKKKKKAAETKTTRTPSKTPKKKNSYLISFKRMVVQEAYSKELNIRATARKYGVKSGQIRRWKALFFTPQGSIPLTETSVIGTATSIAAAAPAATATAVDVDGGGSVSVAGGESIAAASNNADGNASATGNNESIPSAAIMPPLPIRPGGVGYKRAKGGGRQNSFSDEVLQGLREFYNARQAEQREVTGVMLIEQSKLLDSSLEFISPKALEGRCNRLLSKWRHGPGGVQSNKDIVLFVDAKTGIVGEMTRSALQAAGLLTVTKTVVDKKKYYESIAEGCYGDDRARVLTAIKDRIYEFHQFDL